MKMKMKKYMRGGKKDMPMFAHWGKIFKDAGSLVHALAKDPAQRKKMEAALAKNK